MSTMGIDQLIRIWFHVDLSTVIEQNRMPLMFLSYFTKTNRARIVSSLHNKRVNKSTKRL